MKKLLFIFSLTCAVPALAQQNAPAPPSTPAAPPAQPPVHRERTPEQKAHAASEHLVKTLGINDDQKQKVYDLTLMRINKISEIRNQYGADKPRMRAELKALKPVFEGKLKEILTAEQFTKWEQMRADAKNKRQQN